MTKTKKEPEQPRPTPDPAKIQCQPENASKYKDWLANRGGLFVWRSANLSNPGQQWVGPARDKDGNAATKENWQMENTPSRHITDISQVEVEVDKVLKELRCGIRRGGNGLTLKFTDGGSNRIRKEIEKAGPGAYHVPIFPAFEGCPNVMIVVPDKIVPLAEFDHEAWERENKPQT